MDETEEVRRATARARELSTWEQRLFDGVRMVSAEEQAEIAATSRHRPDSSLRAESPHEAHWYGQRLSGVASPPLDQE